MGAYLIDNPGALRQYSARTNWKPSRPTGLTVLHSTEFAPVWRAEAQAAWIARRTDPGSYHDIADTYGGDLWLVPYEMGAWQDGTGSNGMAMSIAFVLRTTDWRTMRPADRKAILRAGARCFARQQAWLKARGYPATPLRLITKAQSDRGEAGFIYHGHRDPTRRTDPGTTPAAPFPIDDWLEACRAALAGAPLPEEDPLMALTDSEQYELLEAARYLKRDGEGDRFMKEIPGRVARLVPGADVDEAALAQELAPLLTSQLARLSPDGLAEVATAVADEQARRQAD